MTRQVALAYGGALLLFAAVLAALVIQVSAGRDPAIKPKAVASAPVAAPVRHVLVRRVIRRVIITEPAPRPVPAAAPPVPAYTAPRTTYVAPRTYVAPAPRPVYVAPAPRPAPVVTRSS